MGHQRPSHSKHLLLASRKSTCHLPFTLFKPWKSPVDFLKSFLHLGFIFSSISSHFKVLQNRHLCKNASSLRNLRHSKGYDLVSRELCQLFSLVLDLTGLSLDKPRQSMKRCGLARSVCPDQRHNFSLVNVKRDTLKSLNHAIIYT